MNKFAFVLAAIVVTGCAPPVAQTPPPSDAAAPPAEDIRTVRATGAYSLRIPASVTQVPVQGIDSAVDRFEGPSFSIMLDYGMYSCGLADPRPGETRETAEIDGRTATLARYRDADGEHPVKLDANFTGLGANAQQPLCLNAHAECADDAACESAREIVSTIDFD